jgi:hypothetical protein
LADQKNMFVHSGKFAQFFRYQQTALSIHFAFGGMSDHKTAQFAGHFVKSWQFADGLFQFFPFGQRV